MTCADCGMPCQGRRCADCIAMARGKQLADAMDEDSDAETDGDKDEQTDTADARPTNAHDITAWGAGDE